jgi:hypothetical protein
LTYTILRFRPVDPRQAPPKAIFARKDDGMIVGGATGGVAEVGEDPERIMRRLFIDHDGAIAWVKAQLSPQFSPGGGPLPPADFEEREGTPMVATVAQMPTRMA